MKGVPYSKDGNKLLFNDKVLINARGQIQDFLLISDCLVVLLDGLKLNSDRNIYCYSLDGKIRWQITEPDKIHSKNYYTAIYLGDNEQQIKAYNINGVEVSIDTHSGIIIKKELIK